MPGKFFLSSENTTQKQGSTLFLQQLLLQVLSEASYVTARETLF
jgi:hypothetical protein